MDPRRTCSQGCPLSSIKRHKRSFGHSFESEKRPRSIKSTLHIYEDTARFETSKRDSSREDRNLLKARSKAIPFGQQSSQRFFPPILRSLAQNSQNLIPSAKYPPTDGSDIVMEDVIPTQQATQPYQDPRRLGRHNSGLSDQDLSDVICILHPMTPGAHEVVALLADQSPQHVAPNADLLGDSDLDSSPFVPSGTILRDIALRFSSQLKNPEMGFTFGRSGTHSDIVLVEDSKERQLSNVHFRIFLNNDGILMLQDISTNGTLIDRIHLKCAKSKKVAPLVGDTRMIHQNAMITVVARNETEIKFMVRSPPRRDHLQSYIDNAQQWIAKCTGQAHVPGRSGFLAASSMSENTYGMHWNGGSEYNVTGHLGKGAFATVYKIAGVNDGVVFAAKELDKRRFMKNGILDLKVENEMRIMKDLRHPNIVQYIDHHEYDQWVYIIMEFVPFGELSSFVHRNGVLTEAMGQNVTRQVLHALQYLHQRGITHRDIKPDNILIAAHNPFLVKLSDFGLSKCVNDQETFLKTFCGTLLYCAPEVYPEYGMYVQGEARKRRRTGDPPLRTSPYDQSVDMWSYGAVLFHVLCGKPPIIGRGDDKGAQMLNNIMTKEINTEPLVQRRISKDGTNFIMALLNRDPTQRPKEFQCFEHPWLRDVNDYVTYSADNGDDVLGFDDELAMIEEALPEGSPNLNIQTSVTDPLKQPMAPLEIDYEVDRLHPRYVSKRPRADPETMAAPLTPSRVSYPILPPTTPEDLSAGEPGPRLFGEISPGAFPSSGVLGVSGPMMTEIPAVTEGVQRVSVNDFASVESDIQSSNNEDIPRFSHMLTPGLHEPQPSAGSAPSLLGAEGQLNELQMSSPEGHSDITSPSTTNPQTPKTREMTPCGSEYLPPTEHFADTEPFSSEGSGFNENEEPRETTQNLATHKRRLTRSVNVPVPDGIRVDPSSLPRIHYGGNVAIAPLRKAATFQVAENQMATIPATELAETIDAMTGKVVDRTREATEKGNIKNTTSKDIPRQISPPGPSARTPNGKAEFVKPPPRLGKLMTIPGSFADVAINLNSRMTSWGRGLNNHAIYADSRDTRIPKYALQITFWAPSIEERIEKGDDWMKIPGIRTVLSTKTSAAIWINGVALRAYGADREEGYLYGKIYTGDVITVFQGPTGYLRFRVEITYGDSARLRPPEEAGFKVQVETKFYQIAKSLRVSQSEGDGHGQGDKSGNAGTGLQAKDGSKIAEVGA